MNIFGYYHIFAVNDYKGIVREQLTRLNDSGLLFKTNTLTISIIGNDNDAEYVKAILSSFKYQPYKIYTCKVNCYEAIILDKIKEDSVYNGDFYCYYIHTKGVSITKENHIFYHGLPFETVKNASNAWRKAMEFIVIDNHDVCIKQIEEGYDAVGMNLCTQPKTHFSGNFWWSKSEYIRSLLPINPSNNDRYLCEFWIGSGKTPKMKSLSQNKSGYRDIDETYIEKFKLEYGNTE